MDDQKVSLPLKRFLLIDECPADWKSLDLYLFRDEAVVFYVGQSHWAFARVWEHLMGGFKWHSTVGRFIWCNWPRSMNFSIELMSSQFAHFNDVLNDLNAAERQLIDQYSPCFNVSLNNQPAPVPPGYFPPSAKLRCSRSLNKLYHEAERAVKADERKLWLQEFDSQA